MKKTDLDWFDQSWYRHFREEINELRERETVVSEVDGLFPHIGVLGDIIDDTAGPAGAGNKW